MTNTQRTLNNVDHAIQLHMQLLEHHLNDMLENLNEARHALNFYGRKTAIGGLLRCEETYAVLDTLYKAIIALHCNADIIEHKDDS